MKLTDSFTFVYIEPGRRHRVGDRLRGKRVLITEADRYMGPDITTLFTKEGADVVADTRNLSVDGAVDQALDDAGEIDILIANLAETDQKMTFLNDLREEDWFGFFDHLAHPLMRLIRKAVPPMCDRKSGKVVAITSAAPLRGIPGASAYCAARGAQNAFIRAVGIEVARFNVQVNAIAQNYVENEAYYPPDLLANDEMMAKMLKVIPAKRLAKGSETAELALFLASENSNFIVGQVIPFAGGWVTTTG